jgi:type II secretory pathway predicted ATPase ExeA
MARVPTIELRRLEAEEHPGYATVVAKANEFLARRGMGAADLADRLGVGLSTMLIYLRGHYDKHPGMRSTQYMDAKVWSHIIRNWPRPIEPCTEELLETAGYRKIRDCIEEAADVGAISLVYGPPSSEKSFVGEQLVAQYRAAGRRDILRIVCGTNFSPLSLLRAIAREAEVWVRANSRQMYIDAIVQELLSREKMPTLILDEAQNLDIDGFETLRLDLHEATRRGGRKGCGLVIMGSHNLYSWFMHPSRKFRLEQFLSRNSYRVQLEGMSREEALEIARRALGSNGKRAKLSEPDQEKLLKKCLVLDPYATDAQGKPLRDEAGKPIVRTYYSSRRLLETIRQQKRRNLGSVLAEAVA